MTKYEAIIRFIKSEIAIEKTVLERFQPQQPTATEVGTPENDFSDNEDKVKIIILEQLGIIDFIKSKQQKSETISHTAEILSSITGINLIQFTLIYVRCNGKYRRCKPK